MALAVVQMAIKAMMDFRILALEVVDFLATTGSAIAVAAVSVEMAVEEEEAEEADLTETVEEEGASTEVEEDEETVEEVVSTEVEEIITEVDLGTGTIAALSDKTTIRLNLIRTKMAASEMVSLYCQMLASQSQYQTRN